MQVKNKAKPHRRRKQRAPGLDNDAGEPANRLSAPLLEKQRDSEGLYRRLSSTNLTTSRVFSWGITTDRILRRLNYVLVSFSLAGFCAMLLLNELCFDRTRLVYYLDPECRASPWLSVISWVCFVGFEVTLIVFYMHKANKKRRVWGFRSSREAFLRSTLKWRFLGESLIHLIQPVPYLQNLWSLGHKCITVLMFLRIYVIVRALQFQSHIFRHRENIKAKSNIFGQLDVHYRVSLFTLVRTHFYTHTISMVSALFVVSVITFGYVAHILERELWVLALDPALEQLLHEAGIAITAEEVALTYWQLQTLGVSLMNGTVVPTAFSSFSTSIWFISVSMTTAGYGDIYPITVSGRTCAMLSCIVGIVITSLIVGVITNKLVPDPFEDFIINVYSRVQLTQEKEALAARIIQFTWRESHKARQSALAHDSKSTRSTSQREIGRSSARDSDSQDRYSRARERDKDNPDHSDFEGYVDRERRRSSGGVGFGSSSTRSSRTPAGREVSSAANSIRRLGGGSLQSRDTPLLPVASAVWRNDLPSSPPPPPRPPPPPTTYTEVSDSCSAIAARDYVLPASPPPPPPAPLPARTRGSVTAAKLLDGYDPARAPAHLRIMLTIRPWVKRLRRVKRDEQNFLLVQNSQQHERKRLFGLVVDLTHMVKHQQRNTKQRQERMEARLSREGSQAADILRTELIGNRSQLQAELWELKTQQKATQAQMQALQDKLDLVLAAVTQK